MPTVLLQNTSSKEVNIPNYGVVPAGTRLSITADQHWPLNLASYPGVVIVTPENDRELLPADGKAPVAPSQNQLQEAK